MAAISSLSLQISVLSFLLSSQTSSFSLFFFSSSRLSISSPKSQILYSIDSILKSTSAASSCSLFFTCLSLSSDYCRFWISAVLSLGFYPRGALSLNLASLANRLLIYDYSFLLRLAVDILTLSRFSSASSYQQFIYSQAFLTAVFTRGPLWRFLSFLALFWIFYSTSARFLVMSYLSYLSTTRHFLPNSILLLRVLISQSKFFPLFLYSNFFFLLQSLSSLSLLSSSVTFLVKLFSSGLDLGLAGSSGISVLNVTFSSSKTKLNLVAGFSFYSYLGLYPPRLGCAQVAIKLQKILIYNKLNLSTFQSINPRKAHLKP